MKNVLLKWSLLGLSLSAIGNVYADYSTIPTPAPGFAISLTGLYLQPSANNLTYAVLTKIGD